MEYTIFAICWQNVSERLLDISARSCIIAHRQINDGLSSYQLSEVYYARWLVTFISVYKSFRLLHVGNIRGKSKCWRTQKFEQSGSFHIAWVGHIYLFKWFLLQSDNGVKDYLWYSVIIIMLLLIMMTVNLNKLFQDFHVCFSSYWYIYNCRLLFVI